MPCNALITGSFTRRAEVGVALKEVGFDVADGGSPEDIGTMCSALGPGSFGCYVQLPRDGQKPCDGHGDATTAIERLQRFLARGVLSRFDEAAEVVPLLRPGACTVLVAETHVTPAGPCGLCRAHGDLLDLLARAIGTQSRGAVRAVVVDDDCPSEELARIAAGREWTGPRISYYAALAPELSFCEWRQDLYSRAASGIYDPSATRG
jgi:hypothetical protein